MSIQLPKPLLRGTTSSRSISDLMREREPKYETMFAPNQEKLGHYYIPPFQRPAVWTKEQSAKLIESVHLGIAIGAVVVSNEGQYRNGKYSPTADWIIDGQQRMRAIDAYLKDELTVFVGTPSEHVFSQLDKPQKRRFTGTPVGFIVLDNCSEELLREIYNRMNFGGTDHTEDQRAS